MPLKQGRTPFPGRTPLSLAHPWSRVAGVSCLRFALFRYSFVFLSLFLTLHTLLLLFIRNIFSHLHKQKGNNCHVFLYYRPGAVEPFCGFRTVPVFIDLILMGIFATGENRRNLSIITASRHAPRDP